jgi:hypothetical protein
MVGGRVLDETLMRSFAERWANLDQYIESVVPFPTGKEDRIVVHFKPTRYPEWISAVRVELTIRLNGDMNLHYIEEWNGVTWECRWGRHENPHNSYEHFHIPPSVESKKAVDVKYYNPPEGVVDVAFQFIEDRAGDLWASDKVYPNSYTFNWEYGPDIRA